LNAAGLHADMRAALQIMRVRADSCRRARVTEAGASVAPATAPLLHRNPQRGDPADAI
jgi:hypothetical protein